MIQEVGLKQEQDLVLIQNQNGCWQWKQQKQQIQNPECQNFSIQILGSNKKDQETKLIKKPNKKDKKTKPIKKRIRHTQNRRHLKSSRRSRNRQKTQLQESSQRFPTHNILPFAIVYLLRHLNEKISKNEIILSVESQAKYKGVRAKKYGFKQERRPTTLNDFEILYNIQEFEEVLTSYYESKAIYKDLMQSRVKKEVQLNFVNNLIAFEIAFKRKEFPGIMVLVEEAKRRKVKLKISDHEQLS